MILCRTFYTLFIHSLIVIEVYTLLIYCFTLFIHFRCHVRVCFCVGWTPTRLFLIRKDDFQETGFLLVLHQRDRLVRSPTADGSDLLGVNSQHHNTMCYHIIWWRSCSFAKMVDFVRMISIHGATKSWCMFQKSWKSCGTQCHHIGCILISSCPRAGLSHSNGIAFSRSAVAMAGVVSSHDKSECEQRIFLQCPDEQQFGLLLGGQPQIEGAA